MDSPALARSAEAPQVKLGGALHIFTLTKARPTVKNGHSDRCVIANACSGKRVTRKTTGGCAETTGELILAKLLDCHDCEIRWL